MNELYSAFLTEFKKKKPKYTVANENKDTQYNMPRRAQIERFSPAWGLRKRQLSNHGWI